MEEHGQNGRTTWTGTKKFSRRLSIALHAVVFTWIAVRGVTLFSVVSQFYTDDAFITLRYAANAASGHGLVWNIGEAPLEGFSNPSFVLLAMGAFHFDIDPLSVFRVVSLLGLITVVGLSYVLARRWIQGPWALLPAVLITGFPGEYLWAASGLETLAYQGTAFSFVWVCFLAFERLREGEITGATALFAMAGFVGAIASVTRPEGPVLILGVLAAVAVEIVRRWNSSGLRGLSVFEEGRAVSALFLVFGVLYIAFLAWKWSYFGSVIPHSVICKSSFDEDPWLLLRHGWRAGQVLLILSLLLPFKRVDGRYTLLVAVPLFYFAILYGADPIVSYMDRHLLLAFALLSVSTAVVLNHLLPVGRGQSVGVLGSASIFIIIFAGQMAIGDGKARLEVWTEQYAARMEARAELGRWLDLQLDPEGAYLIGDAGLVPYLTGRRVIDAFCLNNKDFTSAPINRDPQRFAEAVFEESPDALVVHSYVPKGLAPRPEYGVYAELVEHPNFRADYKYARTFGSETDNFHYLVFLRSSSSNR